MTVLAGIFWALVIVAACTIMSTTIVMLTAGAVHSEVPSLANAIPAWSFRESFFVALGLTVLGSFFGSWGSYRSKS